VPRPDPIPDRYRRITPALVVDGAADALQFYADVFGAKERSRTPGVDATVRRAVEHGATLQRPPQDQFCGDRDGFIIDPFDHCWTVSSHIEDVAPAETVRRLAELSYR
jgi:PhnB protein